MTKKTKNTTAKNNTTSEPTTAKATSDHQQKKEKLGLEISFICGDTKIKLDDKVTMSLLKIQELYNTIGIKKSFLELSLEVLKEKAKI